MDELANTSTSLAENVQEVNSKVIDMGNEIAEIKDKVDNLNENAEQMRGANENATISMETVLDSSNKSVEAVDNISEQIQILKENDRHPEAEQIEGQIKKLAPWY